MTLSHLHRLLLCILLMIEEYCVEHMNPVFHGCAAAAKQASRDKMMAALKVQQAHAAGKKPPSRPQNSITGMTSANVRTLGDSTSGRITGAGSEKTLLQKKLHEKANARVIEAKKAAAKKADEKAKKPKK
jgi:hypothetical protein